MRRETRASAEDPRVPLTGEAFLQFFGIERASLPAVSIQSALTVPAFGAGVAFLSRTLASIPLHAYKSSDNGPTRIDGKLGVIVHENPNPEMDGFKFRQYFWQQVFTGGRGLAWIERNGTQVEALWPINPAKTTIERRGLKLFYKFDGKTYPSEDVIDIPFMLHEDMTSHRGPVSLGRKALQAAIAMGDYAGAFFAGGGIPPLALVGPMPAGPDALKRAMSDITRAIDTAKKAEKPLFPIPPGYELKQVGFDPEKGQMTDARRFQVEEIARVLQLPPVFLQDLSHLSYSNAEQQDLHLVKHLISQWADALEGEMNLKLFGRMNNRRYVEHNLDGLMRGDFKSRIEGITKAIGSGLITPNEGRELENRPKHSNAAADDLHMQGATVPLGSEQANNGAGNDPGTPGNDKPA